TGGSVTSERNSASRPKISSPPKPTGVPSTVSKRQTNTRASPTSSAGSFALTSAALTPSRSHGASGIATRRRRVMTAFPLRRRRHCRLSSGVRSMIRLEPRSARGLSARLRRARRAAHKDAGAVASIDLRVDVFEDHHATVEGDDFSILRTRRAPCRTDIVRAGCAALEAKLLQFAGIGEIHHDAAVRALPDDVGLLALAAGIGLGTRAVFRLVVGRISPTADNLGRTHARRDLGFRRAGSGDLRGLRCAAGRHCQRRQRACNERPTETAIGHRNCSLLLSAPSRRERKNPTYFINRMVNEMESRGPCETPDPATLVAR